MSRRNINVLVTDDHTLFRKGSVMLVQAFKEVHNVFEASNGEEALKIIGENIIDILLLDFEMPIMDGLETAKRVVKKHPEIHIIMVSMHESLNVISDLIEIGVHGYLLKTAEPSEVHKAIISVLNNDFYYNQLVAKAMRQKFQKNSEKSLLNKNYSLTRREIEILQLICQELTMKEISEKLFISDLTIQTHRKNLMKKTHVKNAVGLVKYAIQNHLIVL